MAEEIAHQAHKAATILKTRTNDVRNSALKAIHDGLRDHKDDILKANKHDLDLAQQADLSSALIRRLDLSKGDKYDSMLQGILDVAALEDPVGKVTLATKLDEGLDLFRVTCPVGVILVIFEARPEVIANISSLAIKSGNAAILKGGKESTYTFTEMARVINGVLSNPGFHIPPEALQLVSSRDQVGDLLHQDKHIDLVIPRGSNELVRSIKSATKIPVLGHADGLCSIYLHSDADAKMASRIVVDAKTNYPAGCNAVETVLVNESTVDTVLPEVLDALSLAGVTIKVSEDIKHKLGETTLPLQLATPQDFDTEFLNLTIAIKTVPSIEDAMEHINEHGSHHTDCVVTENEQVADKFLKGIDSAGVYWNASTRFADGFRYGFGTEVGVSTNKIHARGPMGLEGLMCYQYQLRGHGQVASDYAGAGGNRRFIHDAINIEN